VFIKVIANVAIRQSAYDLLLTFYSNYGSISCHFLDIQYRKCCDLDIQVRGHSRSSESTHIDPPPMIFY